jgi:hypothetical protein
MKCITVISDDRVGLMSDISYILGKSNINVEGLFVDVVGGKAVITLEVKDVKRAGSVLISNGFALAPAESLVIKVSNEEAGSITEMLEGEKVHINTLETISKDQHDSVFALNVDKPRKATRLLNSFLLAGGLIDPSQG